MSQACKAAVFVVTKHGIEAASRIKQVMPGADIYVSKKYNHLMEESIALDLPFGNFLGEIFNDYQLHIFVISVGAVVRLIAPYIKDKKVDPAVLTLDDDGEFVIPLLSGHVGKANELAVDLARKIGSQPIVTTASDVRKTLTVDILGRSLGWVLDDDHHNVTRGCAAVVNEEPVALIQETGEPFFWPLTKSLPKGVEYFTDIEQVDPSQFDTCLIVSDRDIQSKYPKHYDEGIVYRPKSLVIGIGCDRHTPLTTLQEGLRGFLSEFGLSIKSVAALSTVDKKLDEIGLIELANSLGVSLIGHSPEVLDQVEGIENPSETVRKYVGTRSVAEAACLLKAGAKKLLHAKQKYRDPHNNYSMTVAIARIPFEKRGHING